MNKAEKVVMQHYQNSGLNIKKIDSCSGLPDFIVNNKFYVEVKNLDYYWGKFLSPIQSKTFKKITKPIFIALVRNGNLEQIIPFKDYTFFTKSHKSISSVFGDSEFFCLKEKKEELRQKLGLKKLNWHDFILKLAKVNNIKVENNYN